MLDGEVVTTPFDELTMEKRSAPLALLRLLPELV